METCPLCRDDLRICCSRCDRVRCDGCDLVIDPTKRLAFRKGDLVEWGLIEPGQDA